MTEPKTKKSERKTLLIFLAVIAVSMVLGFFVGMGADMLADSGALAELQARLLPVLSWLTPLLFLALNLVCLVLSFSSLKKARREAEAWDGESEEVIDRAEARLNLPVMLTNVAMVCNFFLFAAVFVLAKHNPWGEEMEIAIYIFDILVFMVSMGLIIFVQKKTVDQVKKLNPEKKGNTLDMHFQKDWMDSCDEAERQAIGQAAMAAMKTVSTVCLALWLLTSLGCFFFGTGLLPVFCVVAVWLAQSVSYNLACLRMDKKKEQE